MGRISSGIFPLIVSATQSKDSIPGFDFIGASLVGALFMMLSNLGTHKGCPYSMSGD